MTCRPEAELNTEHGVGMSGNAGAVDPLWAQQARQWELLTPPLRPSPEDIVLAQESVDWAKARSDRPLRALVLGATPELASLGWPDDSKVTAVDLSRAMLERVWMVAPGARGKRFALQGDWLQLPLEAQSFGLVLGDGSFSMIGRGMGAALAARIRSVLRREGRFSLRAYVRPAAGETPEEVRDALVSGRIGGFQGFKLRLLMALANEVGEVPVRTAWEWFCRECPAPEAISRRLGWSLEVIETIGAYRGQSAVYWFPTLEEIREVFCADFTELSCRWPGYELGDRCPTLVLQPRV